MNIQLIGKQQNKYTLIINNIDCVYIPPMSLFVGANWLPSKAFVPKSKSVIKWTVGDKQVSYNQIKSIIKNKRK
jgi:hypothetical protein